MKFEAVLYDMDGTLLDTGEGILASIKQLLTERDYDLPGEEVLRTFIGPPVQNSFESILGLPKEEAWALSNEFRKIYQGENLLKAHPYEGIEELLKTLHEQGVPQMVATNKRQDYAQRLLVAMGLDAWIDQLFGSDMEGKLTKADLVGMAAEATGVARERVLMVGDTKHDAIGAAAQGIAFLGVTYGYGFSSAQDVAAFENVGAVDSPLEIMEYFS